MIRFTEFEENEYGTFIPLSAVVQDYEMTIYAVPEAEEAARWLERQGPGKVFLEKTQKKLDRMLRPLARARGYEPDEGYVYGHSLLFTAEDAAEIDRSLIRPDTRQVRWDEVVCRTETVLDAESEGCTIFGTVQNGFLLSFANLNSDDGEVVEIGVETAPGEERKGYASSNAAALCLHFLEKGRRVFYETESSNISSVFVAEKIGLGQSAAEYHYVCFKA